MCERTFPIRLVFTAAALIVLSSSAFAQTSGSPGAIDAATYTSELGALADRVRQADAGSLTQVQQTIPTLWRVEHRGRVVEVDAGWLHQRLRTAAASPASWPAARTTILETLAAARREAELIESAAAPASLPDARQSLDEVLARPEFAQIARENAIERLWQRVVETVRRWWTRMGGDRLPVKTTATLFAYAATLAALAVLVGWLVHALRRASRAAQPPIDPSPGRRMSAQAWARRAIAATDLREAARCAHRAVVSRLDEEGAWRLDDARTPREYLRLLPADHRRRPVAEDITRRFEEIWFGGRPAGDHDRGAIVSRLREIGCLPAE